MVLSPSSGTFDAEENYAKHCLKCHGEDGDGKGPAAAVLDVPAGDFGDCEAMKSVSDDYLLKIIGDGGEAVDKSPQMPAANKIAAEDVPALVTGGAKYIGRKTGVLIALCSGMALGA